MNYKELRIGDLVKRKFYNPDRVEEEHKIDLYDFYWFEESGQDDDYWDNFESLPITEEWVLKFGFEYNAPFFTKNKLSINKNYYRDGSGDYNGFNCVLICETKKHFINLTYVHQLQNLYFALTGKELIFKI